MNDFIAIDFETATESPESAISIGLVRFRNYRPISSYYSLIRPPKLYIRKDFTKIHGLTVDDIKDASDFKHLWESEIEAFIGTTMLAAHYAPFDMGVLGATLAWHELPVPPLPYFCTCKLARKTWQGLHSYALTALANHFSIEYDAHNALDDAMTCGKLVQMSAEQFKTQENVEVLLKTAGVKIKNLGAMKEKK